MQITNTVKADPKTLASLNGHDQRLHEVCINGQVLTAPEGTSILRLALDNGINIPSLCYLEGLSIDGSCRLCMVEIKGRPNLAAACATNIQSGMEIVTHTDRLQEYRRAIIGLLFAQGHHVCAACVFNNHCELQALAQSMGFDHALWPSHLYENKVDVSHERYGFDNARCVLCTRCVRVCAEIEGAQVWQIMGRGSERHVIPNGGRPWGLSSLCTRCGKCVQVCPTGALFDKSKSVGEMEKDRTLPARLIAMREPER